MTSASMFVPNGLLGMRNTSTGSLLSSSTPTDQLEDTSLELESSSLQNRVPLLNESGLGSKARLTDFDPRFGTGLLDTLSSASSSISILRNATNTFEFRSEEDFLGSTDSKCTSKSSIRSLPSGVQTVSVNATTYDGRTIVFKMRTKKKALKSLDRQGFIGLLETPIHKLMDNMNENAAHANTANKPKECQRYSTVIDNADLWVDRYRPQCFTDLLGDERVHRETLSWLKEWDYCVFGRKRPKKTKKVNDWSTTQLHEDVYHRPQEKILLLSGPPGLGKTTLAHVIARQAGYDVFEINASDSRSALTIDDRVRPALEAGSLIGSMKPVCIIVDEIDGATGGSEHTAGFVHKLIQLTYDQSKKKKGKRDIKGPLPVLRPLICICNDLYASSLTKLRQHARVIRFNRPADVHLIKRLRQICENEGLRADSRALTTLVGIAKGDMRGCLNTLQFIKARNEDVTETVIRNATAGMKEAEASSYSVLNDIFTPLSKKRIQELGLSSEDEGKYIGRLSREIDACGSTDKVAWGCFEHYTNLRQYEATMARYESANEWLSTYDIFSGSIFHEQNYAIMPYLAYTLVPFHPLCNERAGPKIERPKLDWENFTKTKVNEEIYQTLSQCIRSASGHRSPGLRHLLANEVMQLELAPIINRIISPPLRPINSQIIRPEERKILHRLVDIMVAFDLRFVQEKAEDGQLVYRLDPPIDVFITYDGKRATDITPSRYSTRHIVAAEIDAKMIALQAEAVERGKTSAPQNLFSRRDFTVSIEVEPQGEGEDDVTNEEGKLVTSSAQEIPVKERKAQSLIDLVDKPPVDFFGRPIILASKNEVQNSNQPASKQFKVSYKFNEGNSAAVRKPVKIAALL